MKSKKPLNYQFPCNPMHVRNDGEVITFSQKIVSMPAIIVSHRNSAVA